jgi:ribonuclease G
LGNKILINIGWKEKRVAVLEQGKLVEFRIERLQEKDAAFGNIYKGKISNVLPGMDAAFVNIGMEKNAFIHACDISYSHNQEPQKIQKLVHPGQEILVQIKKEGVGHKGARVTSNLTIPGRYLVLMPQNEDVGVSRRIEDETERDRLRTIAEEIRLDNIGLIVRTAAEGVEKAELEQDLENLLEEWQEISKKAKELKPPALLYSDRDLSYRLVRTLLVDDLEEIVVDSIEEAQKLREALNSYKTLESEKVRLYKGKEPLFLAYGVDNEIEKSLRRKIWLDCGGFLIFDQTEALMSIDVNTGKYTGHDSLQNTILRTNLEAAEEIARQLRLRNIGGIIIVDFIDMENSADKEMVRQRLEECLKKDRVRTNVLGFTSLGLLELTRQKSSHDLSSTVQKKCPMCGGVGRIWHEETVALKLAGELKTVAKSNPAVSYLLKAHPLVVEKLKEMAGDELEELQMDLKVDLTVEMHNEYKLWEYIITPIR